MQTHKLRLLVKQFEVLYNNIKKSRNNVNSQALIEKHRNALNEIVVEFENILKAIKEQIHSKDYNELVSDYDQLLTKRTYALAILNNKEKMTSPASSVANFDVRTATAVVQIYDGSSDGLLAFIDASKLMKDLTADAHKDMLLKFLKTRLSGKARLGLPDNINTFDELITNVRERCQDLTSPEQLMAKLKCLKQKDNLDSFCEQIENISNKLKNTYIQQQIPENIANKMVNKAAVDALISGVSNNETKLILKAGSFVSVKDAIQKVQENNSNNNNSAIFNMTTQSNHHKGGNRHNFRKQQNYRSNFHYQHNNNNHNYRQRYGNFRNNYHRNNSHPNSNGGGRYNNNNNNRNFSNRVYSMGASQVQVPNIAPISSTNTVPIQQPAMHPLPHLPFLGQRATVSHNQPQNQVQFSQ